MKSSTRVLGMALLLTFLLAAFPISAGARGISNITGTQVEQRHGFDYGRPSVAQSIRGNVPGATRNAGSPQQNTPRRSRVRSHSSHKKYASGKTPGRGYNNRSSRKNAKVKPQEDTTVILSETKPAKHVFISKITPADSSTAKQKDPMQTPKARRVADFLMMGIAGFSIVAALLYVLTAHRRK